MLNGDNEGTAERMVVLTDYWVDGNRPYRNSLHDDRTDEALDLLDLFEDLVERTGAVDGELLQISVRRCKDVVPFGERRVLFSEPYSYRRETEEEVTPLEVALRKAARRAGRPVNQPYVLDESVVESHQIWPDWTERLVRVWQEDEVLRQDPDAEHLPQAVVRLGGEGFDLGILLAKHDDGDEGYDLYPNGWVRGWSYCGDSLYRVVKEKS